MDKTPTTLTHRQDTHHTHTHLLSCLFTAKSGHVALFRLVEASKAESSSFAGVLVSGSLLSLHLCTASPPLLQNYRYTASTSLFFYWLCSLSQALMPLPVTGPMESSTTLLALHSHILYLHRCSSHQGSLSHLWSHCQALCGLIFQGVSKGLCPPSSCPAHWCTANPPHTPPVTTHHAFYCTFLFLYWILALCSDLCLALFDSFLKHPPHTLHQVVPSLSFSAGHVGVLKALHCMSHTTVFYAVPPPTSHSRVSPLLSHHPGGNILLPLLCASNP